MHPVHNQEVVPLTISHAEENRVCGDDITVHLCIEGDTLKNWGFTGQTSMVTTACSSLFWEVAIGQSIHDILDWTVDEIKRMTEIEVSYRRRRAQVIALLATQNAILKHLNRNEFRDFTNVLSE